MSSTCGQTVVKAIPGLPGITGLEFVPGVRKVYTSDWGEEKIGIVDLNSMSVVKRLATAAKPNGSVYAAPFHKVYVADTLGKAVAVVGVDKDEIVSEEIIEGPDIARQQRALMVLVLTAPSGRKSADRSRARAWAQAFEGHGF